MISLILSLNTSRKNIPKGMLNTIFALAVFYEVPHTLVV